MDVMAKVKRAARRSAGKASARGASKPKKPSAAERGAAAPSIPGEVAGEMAVEDQLIASNLSLHELFQQQTRQILDRSDLGEEQKQHILVAMSCPCCGAGAMSFTAKLRR
jgi:hypothetical protein